MASRVRRIVSNVRSSHVRRHPSPVNIKTFRQRNPHAQQSRNGILKRLENRAMQRATPAPVTALLSAAAVAVPGEKLLAVAQRDHALNVATTVIALMAKNALTDRVWQTVPTVIREAHR